MNKGLFLKKILLWDFLCMLVLIAVDRVAKYCAGIYCKKDNYIVFENIFEITFLENYGGAFGILNNQRFFFVFISALFVCLILFLIFAMPNHKKFNTLNIWLAFVLSGTVGNMIDRIIYGYAVDILYFPVINFPVFNLADIFISLGMIFTVIIVLFRLKEKDFEFLNFKQNKYREIK